MKQNLITFSAAKVILFNAHFYDCIHFSHVDLKYENETIFFNFSNNGKFFKEYDSQASASKELEIEPSNICQALQFGIKRKGFYFSTEKQDSFDKARSIQISKRSVYKYSIDGEFIEGFETQKEAELKHPYSNITKSIKLKSVDSNGFMWSLEKLENYNKPKRKGKRKVALLDNEGNILKTWESARQCAKDVGSSVQNVLNGKYLKHKGNIYKYIDN